MAASHKAFQIREALAADIAMRLSDVFAAVNQAQSFDANGDAVLSLGALGVPATTTECAVIRVKAVAPTAPGTDILGLTQDVWTPHVIQMAYEVTGTANTSYLTTAHWTLLLAEMLKFGCRVQIWERTNGTAPAVANMDSPFTNSTLKLTFDPHIQYPLAGQ